MQPRADQKQFTFLVKSDDLFTDQRKATVFAADLAELEENLAQALGVDVGVYVLVHDEDFDEYCLPDSIGEVPQTGRVKVKKRT
jgi:translation elongation factor P/translation initiation factor 5A